MFTKVLKQDDCTPETWRRIRIKNDLQNRHVEEVGNYRPICTLPALYKPFSTITYNRLYNKLDKAHTEDEEGFRRSHQTLDNLATYRMLEQQCHEWSVLPPEEAIRGTEKVSLNGQRKRHVWDRERNETRGSCVQPTLNTTLQVALKDDVKRWQTSKCMGVRLGDHESDCLTNLRFADEVLLFSTSLVQLQKIDVLLQAEYWKCRIENPTRQDENSEQSKYKQKKVWRSTTLKLRYFLCGKVRNILGKKYTSTTRNSWHQKPNQNGLGVVLHIQTRADITIVLPTTQIPLTQHVITPTLSYASGTWTFSKEHERMLRSSQRKMLRLIVQTKE